MSQAFDSEEKYDLVDVAGGGGDAGEDGGSAGAGLGDRVRVRGLGGVRRGGRGAVRPGQPLLGGEAGPRPLRARLRGRCLGRAGVVLGDAAAGRGVGEPGGLGGILRPAGLRQGHPHPHGHQRAAAVGCPPSPRLIVHCCAYCRYSLLCCSQEALSFVEGSCHEWESRLGQPFRLQLQAGEVIVGLASRFTPALGFRPPITSSYFSNSHGTRL